MTTLREAAQQALEALESVQPQNMGPLIHPAKQALRAALAQQAEPVEEPVAHLVALELERLAQEQEPLGWAVQIGMHSAGRRQGKPRYVLFFNKADAEDLADRTRGARPEPFYLERQR